MRLLLLAFVVLAAVVLARVVALESWHGAAYRQIAAQPIEREQELAAPRGRILAQDGSVLACDREHAALAMHYRYLEQPPQPAWLRTQARARLSRSQRRQPDRVAAAIEQFLNERSQMQESLAAVCGLSPEEFQLRARRVQDRVQRLSERVNARRSAREPSTDAGDTTSSASGWWTSAERLLREAWSAGQDTESVDPIVVGEELDYHVIHPRLSLEAVAAIESHPERWPGVRIVPRRSRYYPQAGLAAHSIGHLNAQWRGALGAERQFDALLSGQGGAARERRERGGRLLETVRLREPVAGLDVRLTLDPNLQRTGESLIDAAMSRQPRAPGDASGQRGGAVVVLDVQTGEICALASAPRFDPNVMLSGGNDVASLMNDPGRPFFDRATRMAIPPGSVFKIVAAAALLEEGGLNADEPFYCQGYLQQPDRLRCAVYRRTQAGHGQLDLSDALARSCNVYFFHFGGRLGLPTLLGWAERFGFGRLAGIDLPGEAAGHLAGDAELFGPAQSREMAQATAIGQGTLTATPLQVAVAVAAIANGGMRVTPHIADGLSETLLATSETQPEESANSLRAPPPRPIEGLSHQTIESVRRGLERVVSDPEGSGHRTVYLQAVAIAGKTGTAEAGGGLNDHAWFAGYVPADRPRWALVVALEHGGDGSQAAGPIVRRLVAQMHALGYFGMANERQALRQK